MRRSIRAFILATCVILVGAPLYVGSVEAGGQRAAQKGKKKAAKQNHRPGRDRTLRPEARRRTTHSAARRMRRRRSTRKRPERKSNKQKAVRLDRKKYPHLAEKYERLGGRDRGFYTGKGKNGNKYKLPRRVNPKKDGTRFAARFKRHFASKRQFKKQGVEPGSMKFEAFLKMIEASVPEKVKREVDTVIEEAIRLGEQGLARKFPVKEKKRVRHALLYSWLHSRDMTVLQSALGYPLEATGKHDIAEFTSAKTIKKLAKEPGRSRWFKKYAESLKPGEKVNISFMNPHWLADIWLWKPGDAKASQDAMDAHRKSDHHNGEGGAWDPVEAAVNNVFHQREHVYGVRKEKKARWIDIGQKLETAEGAKGLAKSDVGAGIARDTAKLMRSLEAQGKITPWYLVDPSSM